MREGDDVERWRREWRERVERDAAQRPSYPVPGGELALDPACEHRFTPLNPVALVCERCGGYKSREAGGDA